MRSVLQSTATLTSGSTPEQLHITLRVVASKETSLLLSHKIHHTNTENSDGGVSRDVSSLSYLYVGC